MARRSSSTWSTHRARSSCTRRSTRTPERYGQFGELDLGDVIGVEGEVFQSRRGELTVRVAFWELLAKCLRPLPDKWHGLTDTELRYRHRYVDLITSEESRADAIARVTRDHRHPRHARRGGLRRGRDAGPAAALRRRRGQAVHHPPATRSIATSTCGSPTELYLKRLIVGGIERVFELGKDFRNESVSFKHSPEFTMVEWYQAYADYRDGMALVEKVVAAAGAAVEH